MTNAPSPTTHRDAVALAGGETLAERLATMTHNLLGAADAERRLTWTNPAWQPLLGWTAEELSAGSYHRFVHPDDLDRVRDAEIAVLAGLAGTRPETELRLRARDGSYRWFVFSTTYSQPDGLVFLCGKDVTARKQGEEELRAAEERFRALTGSTRDGIVSADVSGDIIFWNAGAEAIFGRSAADALGRPLTDLMPERHREWHTAGIARFLATGKSRLMGATTELEGLRADGSEFPLEISLGSWIQNDQRCFTGVLRDVSESVHARRALREAEARFAGAFEGAAVGLLLAAPDGTLLLANRALCKLSGRPEEELVGRSYDELLHPDEHNADDAGRRAMLAGQTQRLASERRFLAADGSAMVVRINLSLIRNTAGEPLHFVAQVEDVTERLRMTEALTLSQARYKALIAHLPDSTLHLFDHDLRLLLCEGDRMLSHDYEPQALEGRLLAEVLPPRRSTGSRPPIAPRWRARRARSTSTPATAGRPTGCRWARSATTAATSSAGWRSRATSAPGGTPSASSRSTRSSSSAPTRSSSSSPMSPRTISPSRCA